MIGDPKYLGQVTVYWKSGSTTRGARARTGHHDGPAPASRVAGQITRMSNTAQNTAVPRHRGGEQGASARIVAPCANSAR
jgi:hypothetical protein